NWRLHLQEPARVEEAADGRNSAATNLEGPPRLLVGHQVQVAAALARIGVGEPVVLLRWCVQCLRQHRPRGGLDRRLASARANRCAVCTNEVAKVDKAERIVVLE